MAKIYKMSNKKVRKSNQKPLKSSGSKNNKSIHKNETRKRNLSKKNVSKKIISETESSESEPEIEIKTYKRPNQKKLKKYVSDKSDSESDNESNSESDNESESSSSDNDETEEIQERGERKQLYKMMDKNHMNNVVFQDINEQYAYGQYSEFVVIIDKYTGYINATKLCGLNNNGKGFKNWLPNKHSKKLIKEVARLAGISKNQVIIKNCVGINEIRGTYIHPMLLTHIAYWCSVDFAIKIGIWIEEWKKYSKKNNLRYWNEIKNIKIDYNDTKEKCIQLKLQKKYGGQIEVKTPYGKIDLLTKNRIIEIKSFSNWKHAMGQILIYAKEYSNKDKYIYLFDIPKNVSIENIKNIYKSYDVHLRTINF